MGKTYRLIMIATLLVIIVCAWLGIKTVFVGNNDVKTPSVVGMSLREAVDSLQSEGLLAKIDEVESTEKADTVVSQNIPAGELTSRGKVVLLKVSRGGSTLPIPDVRGLKYEAAVSRLSESGFKVDKVVRVTDKLKQPGIVIAHNPSSPQVVPAGAMVTLLVSTGSGSKSSFVVVPDVSGQTPDMARKLLEESGLTLGEITQVVTDEYEKGLIVSTLPRKGANVPNGATVALRIAGDVSEKSITDEIPDIAKDKNIEREKAVKELVAKEAKVTAPAPAKKEKKPIEEAKVIEKKHSDSDKKHSDSDKKHSDSDKKQTSAENKKPLSESTKHTEAKPVTEQKTVTEQKQATPVHSETKTVPATKKAKVRYQVPPLTKPMSLRIEMTDGNGARMLKEMSVNGGEYLKIDVNYAGNAIVTIYLGGDFVWQDRFN
ncbi:MAG: PASTA domain-containing protein [Synergistaceae bacterium]